MEKIKKIWPFLLAAFLFTALIGYSYQIVNQKHLSVGDRAEVLPFRSHLDHQSFFKDPIQNPLEVTQKCLSCHKEAANQVTHTVHWNWKDKTHGLGKVNLINNFCIGVGGNLNSCTKCHVGYGWKDSSFDFKDTQKVDCLVCHEWSGQYVKGSAGMPTPSTDLQKAAQSVGYPKRENCGNCHYYGGGGLGVKHGDLDNSLINPAESLDVHMGKYNFQCIDCHKTQKHEIQGRAYSVGIDHQGGIDCIDCHKEHLHSDSRINTHIKSVSCQACHIPTFAKKVATKTDWDWSKAGDQKRKDDQHHYLKIKGEFIYNANITPSYLWFNKTVSRYLLGDLIDPTKRTDLNRPRGSISDPTAKIWPFKIHDAKQIYDTQNKYFMSPVTAGEGGFWSEFNWDKALRLSTPITGLDYSGKYDFAESRMYWPISHMVVPARKALNCNDCHGENQQRMSWKSLGYLKDPIFGGGRK